jgi:hypothetical protein
VKSFTTIDSRPPRPRFRGCRVVFFVSKLTAVLSVHDPPPLNARASYASANVKMPEIISLDDVGSETGPDQTIGTVRYDMIDGCYEEIAPCCHAAQITERSSAHRLTLVIANQITKVNQRKSREPLFQCNTT